MQHERADNNSQPFFLYNNKNDKMAIEVEETNGEENKENKNAETQLDQTELLLAMRKELDDLKKIKSNTDSGNSDATVAAIAELVKGLKTKTDDEKYGGENTYVNVSDIDPDDYMEKGVTFFSHRVMTVIVDDKRNGHAVQNPYKTRMIFAYQSTKKVGSGNEAKLHNLSAYTTHSKKEVKWLEEHTGYGSQFFKSHMNAMTTDSIKASKLARAMTVINRLDTGRIIKMAIDLGIEQSEDIQMLRIAIANKQVEALIAKEDEANQVRVKEAIIEKEIIPIKNL